MAAIATIPSELRECDQWVLWRYEERDGKPTKVPYCAATPWREASSTDPSTWAPFEAAQQMRHEAEGIGFVFSAADPFVGIDLDDCIDERGGLSPEAAEILREIDSYAERSPSGRGLHIIVRGTLRGSRRRSGRFEVYDQGRYFTVTGDAIGQRDSVEERDQALHTLCERMFPARVPAAREPLATGSGLTGASDDEVREKAFRAKNGAKVEALWRGEINGYPSRSEADLALCSALAFYTDDPEQIDRLFQSSGLMRPKWERADYRWDTIAKALNRTEFYEPPAQRPSKPAQRPPETEDDREARKQPRRESGEQGDPPPYTDTGNAERFAAAHAGRLRYLRERRHWLLWEDGRWRRDTTGEAERAAKDVAKSLLVEAAQLEGEESRKAAQWALQSQSEPKLRAQLTLAGSERAVVVSAEELDADPYLLACANGVLDLRTGTLREPRPDDLISLGTDVPYEPAARCDRWPQFLDEVFAGDQELIAFMQRFVGYCLTGDTREHVLAVFHGGGCNGKSTLLTVLRHLLGGHANAAAFDTFMRQRNRGPRNDLARLHRARLVTAAESGEGQRLDEATVKEITGGDVIAARFLYGEHFEFRPEFKLVLVTNHRPRVDGDDDAIWRRLRLVPFEQSFEGREDRELTAKLEAELPGILAWAVEGCLAWQREGLGTADAVTRATAEYRADEDVLGAFLAEHCLLEGETSTAELRERYERFCAEVGEKPLSPSVLGKRLGKRGIRKARRGEAGGEKVYAGVSLR